MKCEIGWKRNKRQNKEKGWEGKAIKHYEKFLHLWKNADPCIPEVEDAKKSEMKKRNNR